VRPIVTSVVFASCALGIVSSNGFVPAIRSTRQQIVTVYIPYHSLNRLNLNGRYDI